jgi:serine/threonine-protein kinase RsbT
MNKPATIEIVSELDIITARKLGRNVARLIGFDKVEQARITTAIGELAKNIFLHAQNGKIIIEEIAKEEVQGIAITSVDIGQGIVDIQNALEDDYSPTSAGAGLRAVKRLVDCININSEIGKGTTVKIVKWLS